VIERALAIRRCGALSACERQRRLSALLAAAAEAGFEVERDDLTADGTDAGDMANGADAGDTVNKSVASRSIPEPEQLDRWLVGAGQNYVESWPTSE
jgi:hypothetical protein